MKWGLKAGRGAAETKHRMVRRIVAWGTFCALLLTVAIVVPAGASGHSRTRHHAIRQSQVRHTRARHRAARQRQVRHSGRHSRQVKPFRVRKGSLTQGGRLLYWRANLNKSFSVTTFERERRSLCLLLFGPAHGFLSGRVCLVAGAHPGDGPRLVYQKITHGHAAPGRFVGRITKPNGTSFTATFTPAALGRAYRPVRWQILNSVAPPACSPQPRSGCHTLYPHRARLLAIHTPRVVGCAAGGSSLVLHGPSNRKEIALTFDDGPWNDPPTADFLNVLERNHVVATFFEIGNQISTFDPGGTLERRMLADGDMIGDHTWTHPDMTGLSASEQTSQIEMTANAITQATHGFHTCIWRPPYGAENSALVALARRLGFITVNWDVDTVDWSTPGTGTIYQRAVSGAHNGAIILQHFGGGPRQETLAALPQEIATLRSDGYKFVTIPQLLGLQLIYK
jgi:peptidoglycan/xylan/chitin deacetylase (PgdA/CDA1 family)